MVAPVQLLELVLELERGADNELLVVAVQLLEFDMGNDTELVTCTNDVLP